MHKPDPSEPAPNLPAVSIDNLEEIAAKLSQAQELPIGGTFTPYTHPTKASHEETKQRRKAARRSRKLNRRK